MVPDINPQHSSMKQMVSQFQFRKNFQLRLVVSTSLCAQVPQLGWGAIVSPAVQILCA